MLNSVRSPALKAVLLLLITGCLVLIGNAVVLALSDAWLPMLTAALLWAPLTWGLWQRHPLARRVVLVLLWLIIIVLPIGLINPFAYMDGMVSGPVWKLALPVYGIAAVALFMVHILGKHKAEFTGRHRASPPNDPT